MTFENNTLLIPILVAKYIFSNEAPEAIIAKKEKSAAKKVVNIIIIQKDL